MSQKKTVTGFWIGIWRVQRWGFLREGSSLIYWGLDCDDHPFDVYPWQETIPQGITSLMSDVQLIKESDLITDGGSVMNIVSKKMIDKLQLKMDKHPCP